MPRKPKNDNPMALYEICQKFPNFPQSKPYQRELVGMLYEYVRGPGGVIRTGQADDGRIYHVAKNLYEKAHKTYANLTRNERFILDSLNIIRNSIYVEERESRIERMSIQIENVQDLEISDRVNDAAIQVLGHSIRICDNAGKYF